VFANEIIEPQNFWASSKVMLLQPIYACILAVITLVGPTKVSIMKLKGTVYDEANIFQFDFFVLKTQADWLSRLATRFMIPDTHGSKCRFRGQWGSRANLLKLKIGPPFVNLLNWRNTLYLNSNIQCVSWFWATSIC
jgi:hypothetical protein